MSLRHAVRLLPRLASARMATPAVAIRPLAHPAPVVRALVPLSVRFKSSGPNKWASNPIIEYDELKPITQQPTDNILVIDVREPDEVALGSIPSAVSLPLSQLKESLAGGFSEGEFQKKFAFPKPRTDQNIVFFCRSGKRSATASEWANEHGYKNVRNYKGSWLDWTKREKGGNEDD